MSEQVDEGKVVMNFSSLPSEIYLHIFSFLVADCKLIGLHDEKHSDIQTFVNFQTISRRIFNGKEMEDYFNDFWWRVFEVYCGVDRESVETLQEIKKTLILNGELRRKVILTKYIKYQLLKNVFKMKKSKERIEEVRMIMFGDSSVGKSCLTICAVMGIFLDNYDSTIEDYYRKQVEVDGKSLILELLDTAGSQDFEAFKDNYTRFGNCFIGVCSAVDFKSVKSLRQRVSYIVNIKDRLVNDFPMLFVINKIDLLEETQRKEVIQEYRKEILSIIQEFTLLNTKILETSAKSFKGVTNIYEEGVRMEKKFRLSGLEILQMVIQKDSSIIREYQKSKQKCSVM